MKLSGKSMTAFRRFIGLENGTGGHLEKWLSAIGGLLGILSITLISRHFLNAPAASWVVASMGATAVLVFAVPHGPLSQPWAVLGGHLISAIIGVACARWIPDALLASAVAVAAAIGAMHYLRCIHPPGGATALTAVIGGSTIQAMGFEYVITPVLLNALCMVLIAIIFNYFFHWRRYPAALAGAHSEKTVPPVLAAKEQDDSELNNALQAMRSSLNISNEDLSEIYRLARENKLSDRLNASRLQYDEI